LPLIFTNTSSKCQRPLRIAAHVRDASPTDLGGEHRAKPVPPEPDGLVADVDPALGQQIFDVSKRQYPF
jgi:hypothetical protein